MRGNLFFITAAAFALGVLVRTLTSVPLEYVALSIFFGLHCLAFWLFERRIIFAAAGIILIIFPLGVIRTSFVQSELPEVYSAMLDKTISLNGTITADPDVRANNQQLIVAVRDHGEQTNILVFAPLFEHFSYGERILIAGTLSKPAPFATENGHIFRYDQFLAKKGIFSLVMQADILKVASPSGILDLAMNGLYRIKHRFVAGLSRALPNPYNELATGLLTGDQHGLSEAVENSLALSGLIWVVVLSGYHVTLIAEAVIGLFAFLPNRFRYLFAGSSILAIIIATGASAPSLRGGVMACLMLYARATGRTYDALRALAASLILILLWNPYLLAYDSGFQLSLAVTPALLLGTPIFEYYLLWIKNTFVREIVAVSVVAQLACLPLILWQTGNLSIWAIPANMLVMPLVPFAMLCSVIAGFCGVFISVLAPVIGLPAYGVLFYVEQIAKISSTLPLAGIALPAFPFVVVMAMYVLLILGGIWLKKNMKVAPKGATAWSRKNTTVASISKITSHPTPLRSRIASP